MGSLFSSTKNTRRLISGSSRFIRSDVPLNLTDDEINWLKSEDVLTVIDLREQTEQVLKPCVLMNEPCFEYFSMPVTGGNVIPSKPEDVALSYIKMCDEQMERIIDKIIYSYNGVLFFCNAGKDRTGVVSAIILYTLGFDDEYIINDYMLSAENLKETLQAYADSDKSIDIELITPHEEYIKGFLQWYKTNRT